MIKFSLLLIKKIHVSNDVASLFKSADFFLSSTSTLN